LFETGQVRPNDAHRPAGKVSAARDATPGSATALFQCLIAHAAAILEIYGRSLHRLAGIAVFADRILFLICSGNPIRSERRKNSKETTMECKQCSGSMMPETVIKLRRGFFFGFRETRYQGAYCATCGVGHSLETGQPWANKPVWARVRRGKGTSRLPAWLQGPVSRPHGWMPS
jgi:hypothetical protein